MSDEQSPSPERPAARGVETGTPVRPPRPAARNVLIVAVAALVMAGFVFGAAALAYLAMRAATGGRPAVRVTLRALQPASYAFVVEDSEASPAEVEAAVRSALAAHDVRGVEVRVPRPGRVVIEWPAADREAQMEQAARLKRALEPLPYGLKMTGTSTTEIRGYAVERLGEAIGERAAALGWRAQVQAGAGRRLKVRVRGAEDAEQAARLLSAPGRLEVVHIARAYTPEHTEQGVRFLDPAEQEVAAEQVLAESPVILRGKDLRRNARVIFAGPDRSPRVAIEFRPEGAAQFYEFTRTHQGQYIGIVVDGRVISAPVVRLPVRGTAVIEGGFASAREAQDLANLLNVGPLPLPVEVLEVQGASAAPSSRDRNVARTRPGR